MSQSPVQVIKGVVFIRNRNLLSIKSTITMPNVLQGTMSFDFRFSPLHNKENKSLTVRQFETLFILMQQAFISALVFVFAFSPCTSVSFLKDFFPVLVHR